MRLVSFRFCFRKWLKSVFEVFGFCIFIPVRVHLLVFDEKYTLMGIN